MTEQKSMATPCEADIVIVGAGFSGLYLLHRLREAGFSALILEQGNDVGGTWYWNRYPGARCDVESNQYQLAFPALLRDAWTWSERFPPQPEIEAYLRFVADRLDLRRNIRFGQQVESARFDPSANRWILNTAQGLVVIARFCVMATGCLSVANIPKIDGIETFAGAVYHTGQWPREPVDFSGRRVAVIGTGSSGVQVIPQIAKQAEHLFVLQRTPHYIVPVENWPYSPEDQAGNRARFEADRAAARRHPSGFLVAPACQKRAAEMSEAERTAELEKRWATQNGFSLLGAYIDLTTDHEANRHAAEFYRKKIREIVRDDRLASLLVPTDYPFGAKRLVLGLDYFETYARANVSLIDIRHEEPLKRITPAGVVCGDREIALDAIVFATGFDAFTGAVSRIAVHGRNESLKDKWARGVQAYLGLAVAGFPNLFLVTGPGSPSVLSNVVISIEQHVEWIVACLETMRARGATLIEADEDAEARWAQTVDESGRNRLFHSVSSWYMGDNIPGKPRRLLPYGGGIVAYRTICDDVAATGYQGFTLR